MQTYIYIYIDMCTYIYLPCKKKKSKEIMFSGKSASVRSKRIRKEESKRKTKKEKALGSLYTRIESTAKILEKK